AGSAARLAFASEVKALLALPGMPRRLDAQGLAGVWSLWTAMAPRTVFESVSALPPAHAMAVEADGAVRCWRYWAWPFDEADEGPGDRRRDAGDSDAARAQALHELLIDAVRLQLQADVPVAAYLSGGLDSSAIAALVARHGGRPLVTFSLTFDDAEFDESAHQREVARFLGTPHRPVRCTRADIGRAFARAVWHAETPLVRTAPVPMMLLADAVRASGFKVALTGEGADEVFAGYDLFKEARVRRFIAAPGSPWREGILRRLYPWMAQAPGRTGAALARPFLADLGTDPWAPAAAHASRVRSTQRLHAFLAPEWRAQVQGFDALAAMASLLPPSATRWPPLAREQFLEANTLMSGYLLAAQGDRMAMAASIEARFPFLDHRVMELGARLPGRLKLRGLHEKVLLKRALQSELPATIVARHKQPYRAPDSASFFAGGRLLPEVAESLSPASLADAGLFDAKAVGKLVDKCASGRAVGFADNMAFVGVLSTMLLHEQFVRGRALGL
ncbi:MAG: asparagine synthase (glutamine-hydrolyzing), partial [Burkholderiaceae bacterium]|nr:asparagine synthase (glutamine-hydrolyzing) [Burkholderiaceae bacterium]